MAPEGFLLVDKPTGWTSHDVVTKVRGLAGTRKVGHAGTLDPMATGLLVLGLGRATRLLRFVSDRSKVYEARAQFGVATDTLDADGTETAREPMPVSRQDVEQALEAFRGDIDQVPPMTSAIKMSGRKLYELAREGKEVERPPRPVTIHGLEVTGFEASDFPIVGLRAECSSGTYVRSLADDIAVSLGGRAHLVALRRTSIGSLQVQDAHPLDHYIDDPELIQSAVLSLAGGLADLSRVQVDAEVGKKVSHGSVLSLADLPIEALTAVLDQDGRLLAVYGPRDESARAEVVIA
ncbi:MAG: tRNA pseudouridine(55) synthase TruB [Acidimicrobiia bacterium]